MVKDELPHFCGQLDGKPTRRQQAAHDGLRHDQLFDGEQILCRERAVVLCHEGDLAKAQDYNIIEEKE